MEPQRANNLPVPPDALPIPSRFCNIVSATRNWIKNTTLKMMDFVSRFFHHADSFLVDKYFPKYESITQWPGNLDETATAIMKTMGLTGSPNHLHNGHFFYYLFHRAEFNKYIQSIKTTHQILYTLKYYPSAVSNIYVNNATKEIAITNSDFDGDGWTAMDMPIWKREGAQVPRKIPIDTFSESFPLILSYNMVRELNTSITKKITPVVLKNLINALRFNEICDDYPVKENICFLLWIFSQPNFKEYQGYKINKGTLEIGNTNPNRSKNETYVGNYLEGSIPLNLSGPAMLPVYRLFRSNHLNSLNILSLNKKIEALSIEVEVIEA